MLVLADKLKQRATFAASECDAKFLRSVVEDNK